MMHAVWWPKKKKTPHTILFGMIVNHQFHNVIIQLVTVCFLLISTVCIVTLMHSTRVSPHWNFKNNVDESQECEACVSGEGYWRRVVNTLLNSQNVFFFFFFKKNIFSSCQLKSKTFSLCQKLAEREGERERRGNCFTGESPRTWIFNGCILTRVIKSERMWLKRVQWGVCKVGYFVSL